MDLKIKITEAEIKKIFSNELNKQLFIKNKTGKSKEELSISSKDFKSKKFLDNWIIQNWDYLIDKKIIRNMFEDGKKRSNADIGKTEIPKLINEYWIMFGKEPSWPCNQSNFDGLTQKINKMEKTRKQKDNLVTKSALQFRRMKEIKTFSNDYLECAMISISDSIIPTLSYSAKGDYFINGICYDQKSTHVSEAFIKKWNINKYDLLDDKDLRIKYCTWLYENQGPDRFDADRRIYVIALDSLESLTTDDIKNSIINSNFWGNTTLKINFNFGKGERKQAFNTECKIVLLRRYNKSISS